ncbi:MAG: OmpA family protein [Alphaproteobacteria bacterium]|nr:OmpA family protein [Alphaproteobacteria bacterium]
MRYFFILALCLATAAPALAQMYPGEDVTVNPEAAGTQVLLYPGGKYLRVLPPLLQPGETNKPIKLRKPRERHLVLRAPRHRSVVAEQRAETPVAAAPRRERHTRVRAAETAPAPVRQVPVQQASPAVADNAPAADLSELGDMAQPATPKPAPVRTERKPPPQRTASIAPPPARTPAMRSSSEAVTGSPRGSILFAANATDPNGSAIEVAKNLAKEIDAALGQDSTRVQLIAYAGPKGEKTSDTRRLSLRRALIVRQLLIDDGVPSERIDVRAMGGTDDNGPLDRVDVFLKG